MEKISLSSNILGKNTGVSRRQGCHGGRGFTDVGVSRRTAQSYGKEFSNFRVPAIPKKSNKRVDKVVDEGQEGDGSSGYDGI